MKCTEMESRAMAYLDGKLSAPERKSLELHMQVCSECAERIKGFSQVFELLDEWEEIQPSADFHARLEQRLEKAAPSGWWERFWSRLVPVPVPRPAFSAIMLAVLLLAVTLVRYSPAPPEAVVDQQTMATATANFSEVDDMALYQNLTLLEDWEVVANFEVLQELQR